MSSPGEIAYTKSTLDSVAALIKHFSSSEEDKYQKKIVK